MRILYYANLGRVKSDDGWDFPEWVAVPQSQLMADMRIKEKHKLYRVRDELVAAGYIEIMQAKGREPARYHLSIQAAAPICEEPTPKPMPMKKPTKGSFDTEDFFEAAVRKAFGE
jgi:hypothetical protein